MNDKVRHKVTILFESKAPSHESNSLPCRTGLLKTF